jgi:hypothetical protein
VAPILFDWLRQQCLPDRFCAWLAFGRNLLLGWVDPRSIGVGSLPITGAES